MHSASPPGLRPRAAPEHPGGQRPQQARYRSSPGGPSPRCLRPTVRTGAGARASSTDPSAGHPRVQLQHRELEGAGRGGPPQRASASRPPPLKPAGEDNGVSCPTDTGGFGERQAGHRVPRPLPLSPAVRAKGCQLQGQLCAQGTSGGHPSQDTGRTALPHPGPHPQGSRRWFLRPSLVSDTSSSNPRLWVFLTRVSCAWRPPFSHPEHQWCVSCLTDQDQPSTRPRSVLGRTSQGGARVSCV